MWRGFEAQNRLKTAVLKEGGETDSKNREKPFQKA